MTNARRAGLLSTAALLLLASAAPAGGAALSPRGADGAKVEVLVIRASDSSTEIAPELRDLAAELKKQFKFTGFKLEHSTSKEARLDQPAAFDLIEHFTLTVTPTKLDERRAKMQVLLARTKPTPRELLKTVFSIERGKYQFIGGPKLANGDTLIVGIRVK